ncbi:hypothetical protein [Shewanella psychromarinicola]|uniref:hypothetical protein n=1 Tax=Shewanella psychromarinicola TaxID=2487742 RepID=UPI003F4C10A4
MFTLQTLPVTSEGEYGQLANTSGFSLHAATSFREISAKANKPDKLERLCLKPPVEILL